MNQTRAVLVIAAAGVPAGGCGGAGWAMSSSTDGDRVSWLDFEPLDPDAGPAQQKVTEVFNSVPWTRTGEEPKKGEQ